MVNGQKDFLHGKICGFNLIYAIRIAAKVKSPPYIPMYEVFTYQQIADYFKVTEKRVRNVVSSHRHWFDNDYTTLSGKDIEMVAAEKQDFGCHYGVMFVFRNGVKINASHGANTVFNSRAILHFALYLYDESRVAKDISDILYEGFYKNKCALSHLPKAKQWFEYEECEEESDGEMTVEISGVPKDTQINVVISP